MSSIYEFESRSERQTVELGIKIARLTKPGDIICLFGDLGSGKTTLVKGIAQGLKINPNKVNSPTFVLMNIYEGRRVLYHFDFYRLNEMCEIGGIGYDEFLYGEGLSVIEWADRMDGLMPAEYLGVYLYNTGETDRVLKISAKGRRYQELLKKDKQRLLK